MSGKAKIPFADLLEYIRDGKSYRDVREAVAESGHPNTERLLQHVDSYYEKFIAEPAKTEDTALVRDSQ